MVRIIRSGLANWPMRRAWLPSLWAMRSCSSNRGVRRCISARISRPRPLLRLQFYTVEATTSLTQGASLTLQRGDAGQHAAAAQPLAERTGGRGWHQRSDAVQLAPRRPRQVPTVGRRRAAGRAGAPPTSSPPWSRARALNTADLGEYWRKRGLLPEQLQAWRSACEQANDRAAERSRQSDAEHRRQTAMVSSCLHASRAAPAAVAHRHNKRELLSLAL
jgi:hypothetical protein